METNTQIVSETYYFYLLNSWFSYTQDIDSDDDLVLGLQSLDLEVWHICTINSIINVGKHKKVFELVQDDSRAKVDIEFPWETIDFHVGDTVSKTLLP